MSHAAPGIGPAMSRRGFLKRTVAGSALLFASRLGFSLPAAHAQPSLTPRHLERKRREVRALNVVVQIRRRKKDVPV